MIAGRQVRVQSLAMGPSEILHWLLGPAPTDVGELVRGFAERLVAAQIPIDRLNLSLGLMHPEVLSRIAIWTPQGCVVRVNTRRALNESRFLDSPVAVILAGGGPIRRRLAGPTAQLDYPVCSELAADGFTDYSARGLRFSDGRQAPVTMATRAPDGFSDQQLASLDAVWPALALRIELASAHIATRSLLEVYLGQNAARRVLAGEFVRGSGTPLRAAVWTCDLRDFTGLSDRLPPLEVTRLLDAYFERVVDAVTQHGGEVLKFIGDAILAVFPADEDPGPACARALAAARQAVAALAQANLGRAEQLIIGVALHLGEVFYGNIGGSGRLDFTVIGAAVNEVCRLEALCKSLGTPIILSAALREHLADADLLDLGEHPLRGVRLPQRVFGVATG